MGKRSIDNKKAEIQKARKVYMNQLKAKLGVRKLEDVAEKLGMAPMTLYNFMRPDRHATSDFIERLRRFAPTLDPSPFIKSDDEDKYQPTLLDLLDGLSDLARPRTFQGVAKIDTEAIVSTLGQDDFVVTFVCLDDVPSELQLGNMPLVCSIAESVTRGVTHIYCVPSDDAPIISLLHSYHPVDGNNGLLTKLKNSLPFQKHKERQKGLIAIKVTACPYHVPTMRFTLILRGDGLPEHTCLIRVGVTRTNESDGVRFTYPLDIPLDKEMSAAMLLWLLDEKHGILTNLADMPVYRQLHERLMLAWMRRKVTT